MRSKLDEVSRKAAQMRVIIYKTKKSELVDYMKTRLKDVKIEDVRNRLSKVKESLAEDIIKHRE